MNCDIIMLKTAHFTVSIYDGETPVKFINTKGTSIFDAAAPNMVAIPGKKIKLVVSDIGNWRMRFRFYIVIILVDGVDVYHERVGKYDDETVSTFIKFKDESDQNRSDTKADRKSVV